MSLAIDLDAVARVLLADGTWYEVANESFMLDSYEYIWQGDLTHGGGNSGVCATGFSFSTEYGARISGPLTAILAVEHS